MSDDGEGPQDSEQTLLARDRVIGDGHVVVADCITIVARGFTKQARLLRRLDPNAARPDAATATTVPVNETLAAQFLMKLPEFAPSETNSTLLAPLLGPAPLEARNVLF